jgi:hypothetical protein
MLSQFFLKEELALFFYRLLQLLRCTFIILASRREMRFILKRLSKA